MYVILISRYLDILCSKVLNVPQTRRRRFRSKKGKQKIERPEEIQKKKRKTLFKSRFDTIILIRISRLATAGPSVWRERERIASNEDEGRNGRKVRISPSIVREKGGESKLMGGSDGARDLLTFYELSETVLLWFQWLFSPPSSLILSLSRALFSSRKNEENNRAEQGTDWFARNAFSPWRERGEGKKEETRHARGGNACHRPEI